jgi:integrase
MPKSKKDGRRTRGDGGLYQRANGLWVASVEVPTEDGSRKRRNVSSMDRNVCIDKLKKLRRAVEDGTLPVTGKTTVADWLTRWIDEIHGPSLRPTTQRDYRHSIDHDITPHIGTKRLDRLTPAHVRQMHKDIESSRQAQKAHVVLQRALTDAVREGMLTRNVAQLVAKPGHVTKQRRPLTTDQARQMLRVASTTGDPLVSRWAAALLLGARQGELLGLEWDRVDLTNGTVDLAWQLQQLKQSHGCGDDDDSYPCGRVRPGACPRRRWDMPRGFEYRPVHRSLVLTRPKTKTGTRLVPLPAPLWTLLERHPRGDVNPHGLVWHHPDGRPMSPRSDLRAWQAALAAADIPAAGLHVARNTTATLLMEAGVDAKIIQAILGHANIVTTRGYQYVDQGSARQAMAALDQLLAIEP